MLSYDSFRTILAVAADRGWRVRQLDISNAYLQGKLVDSQGRPREIYMEDPLGRVDPVTGKKYFLKLLKPIYGLKQSGRLFCNELHSLLLENGFMRMPTDSCCLFKLEVPGAWFRHGLIPFDGANADRNCCCSTTTVLGEVINYHARHRNERRNITYTHTGITSLPRKREKREYTIGRDIVAI